MNRITAIAALLVFVSGWSIASADLVVDFSGTPGTGITQVQFSGSSSTNGSGVVRTVGNDTFNNGDTFEPNTPNVGDWINDVTIQNSLFDVTGSATISVGGNTGSIGEIFLDEDGSFDDFGIRLIGSSFSYSLGDDSNWTGSGTIDVDISAFNAGQYSSTGFGGFSFAQNGEVFLNVSTVVPEPSSAIVGFALVVIASLKRRKI